MRTNRRRFFSTQNCFDFRSPLFAPTTYTDSPSQESSRSLVKSNPWPFTWSIVACVDWRNTSKPRTKSMCTKGCASDALPFWYEVRAPFATSMPLPSAGGPMSIRRFPGSSIASCQISLLSVPSSLCVVLFCVKVRVSYQLFW